MTKKDINFDEMLAKASIIMDEDSKENLSIEEASPIYKLDDELLNEGWDYDSTGIYIPYTYKYEKGNPQRDEREIFLKVERNLDKSHEMIYSWVTKQEDSNYRIINTLTRDTVLANEDIKINEKTGVMNANINKSLSSKGRLANLNRDDDTFKDFFFDLYSKITNSPSLEVFKVLDYDAPEGDYVEEETIEDSSEVIPSFSEYSEDIQKDVKKILDDGTLFEETQKSISLTHQGHYTTRDALILCESSVFVGDGSHSNVGGDSGEGKSDLAFAVGLNFPQKYVKILRNISPKNIYYDSANYNNDFNILIFDDLPLTEDMINILKELTDNTKKVKELKTVINGESKTFTLEGKFVIILTYAKEIPDYELANRLLNFGVTIVDKSKGKYKVKSKIRDNNVIGGNDNLIIQRNRLIIQASIHYLIEQDIHIFNPFLAIFNPDEYNNRDVNHLSSMVKAKTFFEYSKRNEIRINDDLAITIGSYDDFKFASDIWANDGDAQKYKLSENHKKILKVMEGYEMTKEEAYAHIDEVKKEYDKASSRRARAKVLEGEFTKKTLAKLTGIKENSIANVLDRNSQGTSKTLYDYGLIDKIQVDEDISNSPNIYYKVKNEGEGSNHPNNTMYTMYSQFNKLNSNSYYKSKIIIDLLYYVNVVINERGYTYLKKYCDNYDEEIDVESYDSMFNFIKGFFNNFNYDEYSIKLSNASLEDITNMANYRDEINKGFDENLSQYSSAPDCDKSTQYKKSNENAPIPNPSDEILVNDRLHSEHSNQSKIRGLLEEKGVDIGVGYSILKALLQDDLTKYEIQNRVYPNPNPDDVDEKLVLGIEMNLKRLVDNHFISIKTSFGQVYHIEDETRKILEGDD